MIDITIEPDSPLKSLVISNNGIFDVDGVIILFWIFWIFKFIFISMYLGLLCSFYKCIG